MLSFSLAIVTFKVIFIIILLCQCTDGFLDNNVFRKQNLKYHTSTTCLAFYIFLFPLLFT